MTRTDARMIAEELYRLMQEGGQIEETWLSAKEAAAYIGRSASWMRYSAEKLPRKKVGGRYLYPKSQLNAYLNK